MHFKSDGPRIGSRLMPADGLQVAIEISGETSARPIGNSIATISLLQRQGCSIMSRSALPIFPSRENARAPCEKVSSVRVLPHGYCGSVIRFRLRKIGGLG